MWRVYQAVLAGPVTMAGVIPTLLLVFTGSIHIGWSWSPAVGWLPALAGLTLAVIGLVLVVRTVRLFAVVGRGTLAPWDPPRNLVVRGPYRHVRNPMISGVIFVLFGETTFFGSWPLLVWSTVFATLNAIYIRIWEEPKLRQRFGGDYETYAEAVPPWVPRLRPWDAPS